MDQTTHKKKLLQLFLLTFGLSALFVLLARLYTITSSDVMVMYTIWPEIIYISINVLECSVYGIAYAYLIYVAYRFWDKLPLFALCYGVSVCFKYLLNCLVTWIVDAGMSSEFLLDNLWVVFVYIAIELLQASIFVFLLWLTMRKFHAFVAQQAKIAVKLPGTEVTARTYAYPFTSLLSLQNPLQASACYGGLIVTGFKVISRLISDINVGWPVSLADALWILLYYTLDIFAGFAVCMLITYLLIRFDQISQRNMEDVH